MSNLCFGGTNTGHPDSDGCYAWPKVWVAGSASEITQATQAYSYCAPNGCSGNGGPQFNLDTFYDTSVDSICAANNYLLAGCKGDNGRQLLVMGVAFKGFDDLMTQSSQGWYQARVATQGCGSTWINTWKEMTHTNPVTGNSDYDPVNNPLPFMMVATWDDYEEGTETETGIDNCIQISTFTHMIAGTQLKWTYQFVEPNDSFKLAGPDTVDHYDLYSTTDNSHYALLDHDITPGDAGCTMPQYPKVTCSGVDLSNYALQHGTQYTIFVEAIGEPSITNWVFPGVSYTP